MTRIRTVPSPNPASKTRTAGGVGWMFTSSIATRCATTDFSEQVLTNSWYFCRLSKKRKLRPTCAGGSCGSASGAGSRAATGASIRNRRPARAPARASLLMNLRTRSAVAVVIRPPSRRRLTNFPSLTANRPNVDSATPALRQYSTISRSSASASTWAPCRLLSCGRFQWNGGGLSRTFPAHRESGTCSGTRAREFDCAVFGDDRVHGDVVRLRVDARERRHGCAHADGERTGRRGGERPVVEAATVAEPV